MDEAERRKAVRRIARAGDPDRSIAALFMPVAIRADLFSLYAFNVELARIAEQVSEPDLGAIRLQWWREAIEGEPIGHPVADAFGDTVRRRALRPESIDALIEARRFELANKIMPDGPALDFYLRNTAGRLFALTAEIMGVTSSEQNSQLNEMAGQAYGLTGLMRALPVHAATGRIFLPADVLRSYGAAPERILAGHADEGLLSLLSELRARARRAFDDCKRHLRKLDASARPAFRPLCLVEPYLAALARHSRDPLGHVAEINPLVRLWRMVRWT